MIWNRAQQQQETADKLTVYMQHVLCCLIAGPDGLGSLVHLMAFGSISWYLAASLFRGFSINPVVSLATPNVLQRFCINTTMLLLR